MPAASKDSSNTVTELVTSSSNQLSKVQLIDALLIGSKWGGNVGSGASVYLSFPTTNSSAYWSSIYYDINYAPNQEPSQTRGFSPVNSNVQTAAISALQAWANVANISFQTITETTSAVFVLLIPIIRTYLLLQIMHSRINLLLMDHLAEIFGLILMRQPPVIISIKVLLDMKPYCMN
jgi:hypothetical protein